MCSRITSMDMIRECGCVHRATLGLEKVRACVLTMFHYETALTKIYMQYCTWRMTIQSETYQRVNPCERQRFVCSHGCVTCGVPDCRNVVRNRSQIHVLRYTYLNTCNMRFFFVQYAWVYLDTYTQIHVYSYVLCNTNVSSFDACLSCRNKHDAYYDMIWDVF